MPLEKYGVLKGRVIKGMMGRGNSSHYEVYVSADDIDYRIAINIKSQLKPSELLFYINENFQNKFTNELSNLPFGFISLKSKFNQKYALDFIRQKFFTREDMIAIPPNKPGENNDLNEKVDKIIQECINDDESVIYAFGEKWGPEVKRDKYFDFMPGRGIHDIHMNQGNDKQFEKDNGIWQDGGIFVNFPSKNKWTVLFLAFQSQVFYTDDNGNPQKIK